MPFNFSSFLNDFNALCTEVDRENEKCTRKGESSREMRFSLSPPPGKGRTDGNPITTSDETNSSSDFNQWLHAMKMVARLPGGMPPEFRRKLWLALAEKYLKSKNVDWEKEEVKCFSEQWREDDEELGIQIVKDLHRTGSSLCSGPAGTINQAKLKRILLGYARFNPEVGYCQGFNMLGALILQVMDKEEIESIKVMIYLVEGILPSGYFSGSLGGLQADMAVFRELMTSKLPKLAKHLQKLQGPVENAFEPPLTNVFTMQWFLTMFCTCLPMTCVLRVWDLVLIEGSDVLLRTALVLWSLLEERILNARTADDFYCQMGSFSSELLNGHLVDSNGLIEKVVDLGPIPDLQKLRDKHLYNISPFRDKKGLQLYYSDEDGDSDEDSRMAVATAWGLRLSRRGSQTLSSKSDNKDRIALDISLLKKQYDRLRERQRQAHIILTSAVARQGSNPNQSSIQMNQLLMGRNAIVTNNGRRLGPPQGAIPPARKPSLPTTKPPKLAQTKSLRSGETLHWRDTDLSKRRRDSLKWKDIKSESVQINQDEHTSQITESAHSSRSSSSEPKSKRKSLKSRQRSDSSSYSEESDGNSSTSTSLCDEDDHEAGDRTMSSLEGSPFKKSKSSKKHSEVPKNKSLEDVLNSNDNQTTKDSQIPFIQLTTIDSPVINATKTEDSLEHTKEDSETESSRLDYAGFVDEYSWPDLNATTASLALEDATIDVTSDEGDYLSVSNVITSTSQLSPIPDIATYINNSSISPLRTPISAFDYTSLVESMDEKKKFDVNEEGVTNEYFERVNIVERPTKLDLLYSLNEEDSIRNAYASCEASPIQTSKKDTSPKEDTSLYSKSSDTDKSKPSIDELDRKMKVLLEYSNKSSLSFIAEAKHEISSGIFKEEFDANSLKYQPATLIPLSNMFSKERTTFLQDEPIEHVFDVPSILKRVSVTSPSKKNTEEPFEDNKLFGEESKVKENKPFEENLTIGNDKSSEEESTFKCKNILEECVIKETHEEALKLEDEKPLEEDTKIGKSEEVIEKPERHFREGVFKTDSFEHFTGGSLYSSNKGKEEIKKEESQSLPMRPLPTTEDLESRFRAMEMSLSGSTQLTNVVNKTDKEPVQFIHDPKEEKEKLRSLQTGDDSSTLRTAFPTTGVVETKFKGMELNINESKELESFVETSKKESLYSRYDSEKENFVKETNYKEQPQHLQEEDTFPSLAPSPSTTTDKEPGTIEVELVESTQLDNDIDKSKMVSKQSTNDLEREQPEEKNQIKEELQLLRDEVHTVPMTEVLETRFKALEINVSESTEVRRTSFEESSSLTLGSSNKFLDSSVSNKDKSSLDFDCERESIKEDGNDKVTFLPKPSTKADETIAQEQVIEISKDPDLSLSSKQKEDVLPDSVTSLEKVLPDHLKMDGTFYFSSSNKHSIEPDNTCDPNQLIKKQQLEPFSEDFSFEVLEKEQKDRVHVPATSKLNEAAADKRNTSLFSVDKKFSIEELDPKRVSLEEDHERKNIENQKSQSQVNVESTILREHTEKNDDNSKTGIANIKQPEKRISHHETAIPEEQQTLDTKSTTKVLGTQKQFLDEHSFDKRSESNIKQTTNDKNSHEESEENQVTSVEKKKTGDHKENNTSTEKNTTNLTKTVTSAGALECSNPIRPRIPSTEDLESRYRALERQFSDKKIDVPNKEQSTIIKEPKENTIKMELELALEDSPKIKTIPEEEKHFSTSTETEKGKIIPSTADLEHRFRELERKLSAKSLNSPSKPQEDVSKVLQQSNMVSNPSIVIPNNEDSMPISNLDKTITSNTFETDDEPQFLRKRIPSTEDLETRFEALEIEKSLRSPTSNLLSPSKLNTEFLISTQESDAKLQEKSDLPSTEDLEKRFQAFEASKLDKREASTVAKTSAEKNDAEMNTNVKKSADFSTKDTKNLSSKEDMTKISTKNNLPDSARQPSNNPAERTKYLERQKTIQEFSTEVKETQQLDNDSIVHAVRTKDTSKTEVSANLKKDLKNKESSLEQQHQTADICTKIKEKKDNRIPEIKEPIEPHERAEKNSENTIPSTEDLETRFEALDFSTKVNDKQCQCDTKNQKGSRRLPSLKSLESRFEALEKRKSFTENCTKTKDSYISPDMQISIESPKKKEETEKKVSSTQDLESRLEALEQRMLLTEKCIKTKISTEISTCEPKHENVSNKDSSVLDLETIKSAGKHTIENKGVGKIEYQEDNKSSSTSDLNSTKTSKTIVELKTQELKRLPSTEDLELRFKALEDQKAKATCTKKAATIENKKPNLLSKRTEKEDTTLFKSSSTTEFSPKSKVSEQHFECTKMSALKENQDLGKDIGKLETTTNQESRFKALEDNMAKTSDINRKKQEEQPQSIPRLSHIDREHKTISKVPSTHDLEKRFNDLQIATKLQRKPGDEDESKVELVLDKVQDSENPIENSLEVTESYKRRDLYKLESQSDETLTSSDPTNTEFDTKSESRPTSCPEYRDPFDTNVVTTDRVLKIIEENSMILHRILKKTLADSGGDSDTKAQSMKNSCLTDSLLALGNIFPRNDESISPSRIKSHSRIHPSITLRSDDSISDRLASIKSTIKSIDTLCEEKSFHKEKCQRYIDSLFARPTIATTSPSPKPLIKVDDYERKSSQDRLRKRELIKESSPRRRRDDEREEYESRVRRDMLPNSLDAPSEFSFSLENIAKVDSEVDRINQGKQLETQLEKPLSPYYASGYDLNKRSITPVVYVPTKLEIRHTTVTSTFYDRYLTEKHIEKTFPRSKKSPISPTMTKSYLDISKYSSSDLSDRSSKSAENSPSRRKDGGGLSPKERFSQANCKRSLISTLDVGQKDLHIRSCDNILYQLRSTQNNDVMPSIMVYNPLPTKIRKPPELGINLGLYKDYDRDASSKS